MSAFKEALEELAAIENAEERGLKAALLDEQIESATTDEKEIENVRNELEKTKREFEDMRKENSNLKVKYADLYFSGADDKQPPKTYNQPKPTTLKDILG